MLTPVKEIVTIKLPAREKVPCQSKQCHLVKEKKSKLDDDLKIETRKSQTKW